MLSISLNFKQLSKCDIINASKPSIKSSDENEVSPIDRKKIYCNIQTPQQSNHLNPDGFLIGEVVLTTARSIKWLDLSAPHQWKSNMTFSITITNIYKKLFSKDIELTKILEIAMQNLYFRSDLT